MNLIIKINLDGAAFEDDMEAELENMMEQVQDNLATVKTLIAQAFVVRDTNGNTVGSVEIVTE